MEKNGLYGRYQGVRGSAWQFLIENVVDKLPVNLISIARQMGIKVMTYSKGRPLIDFLGLQEVSRNNDGFSIYSDDWTILYDETVQPRQRIRFTVGHELGHILLGHETELRETTFCRIRYTSRNNGAADTKMEQEADSFAARILAPACVLWGLDIHKSKDIQELCGLPQTAASARALRMRELYRRNLFLSHPMERVVFAQFQPFLEKYKKAAQK